MSGGSTSAGPRIQPTVIERRGGVRPLWRAMRDLALVPIAVVFGFAVLAALSIIADQTQSVGVLNSLRSALSNIVGPKASSTALQAIATGLVTVTSITFSVLLLAVQQTASNLSPVVFDQFMHRRSNQAFLGFFVGLALFSYVVMAAVQDNTPPIVGASVATLLTVVALLFLLALVYSTISQMRPTNVLRVLHDMAITAREREAGIVRRTRRESAGEYDVAVRHVSRSSGYVSGIRLDLLEQALDCAPGAEIELFVAIGDRVSYGDTVAVVRDGDIERADRIADAVAAALELSKTRDLGNDATTGVDEMGNIAWTSSSTAKHSPEAGREALYALKDIIARWILDDPVNAEGDVEVLPIVYRDNDLPRALSWLYSMLVAAHESQQHMIAAEALNAYGDLIEIADDGLRKQLRDDLETAAALLGEMPTSPALNDALDAMRERLGSSTALPAA